MIALTLLTTGTTWAEDFPKDSLKVVDIEEVVVIATPKENRKLRELPAATTVLSQKDMQANQLREKIIRTHSEYFHSGVWIKADYFYLYSGDWFTYQHTGYRTLCRQHPLY